MVNRSFWGTGIGIAPGKSTLIAFYSSARTAILGALYHLALDKVYFTIQDEKEA